MNVKKAGVGWVGEEFSRNGRIDRWKQKSVPEVSGIRDFHGSKMMVRRTADLCPGSKVPS